MIDPIPFAVPVNKHLLPSTMKEFQLSQKDEDYAFGLHYHKYDHILQNIQLASLHNEFENAKQSFRKSVLNKNNHSNLHLIKERK